MDVLSQGKSPIFGRDGIAKFQPVEESEVLAALKDLKPGEVATLAGPEVVSWGEIVKVLKAHVGTTEVHLGGTLESLRHSVATCSYIGDLLYPSHIQQLYRLLSADRIPAASKTGKKRLSEVYTPGTYQAQPSLAWHRVILD